MHLSAPAKEVAYLAFSITSP